MNTKETFVIQGLAGEKKLKGTVKIHGAKNAVLKAMAATILIEGPVKLTNVPRTEDVITLIEILRKLGASVEWSEHELVIDTTKLTSTDIDADMASKMRASVVLTGPLLARFGRVTFAAPGGCVIGNRPIDLFIEGYKKMGAHVTLREDSYLIEAPHKLSGTEIFFNFQTVGGTETLMMAAVLSSGTTVLKNCAMEPEIQSVAEWLNSCGATIGGAGTTTITVKGTGGKLLTPKTYDTLPDRIEAGSYLLLGGLCATDMIIENCRPDHLEAVTNLLRSSGVPIEIGANSVRIVGNTSKTPFAAFSIRTHEYPGFPTDIQSPAVTFLTHAAGESTVLETIFEGRFKFTEELIKMGANITIMNPREILIKGPTPLKELAGGETLAAHDIRAGFAIVMAALIGTGTFTVTNVHLIDRGYERLEEQLTALGANIQRKSA